MEIEFDYEELVINYINEKGEVVDCVEYYETFEDLPDILTRLAKDASEGKKLKITVKGGRK
ncbi:hypothetical protein HOR18_gp128 [Staphylococcus phage vB_SscM-1]|uniref:Uncharacterized protein n=2 Tax=Sciuriunavirus SscM1 TaxID=2734053 RepID=A0A1X9I9U3_9CAUD|nr:hypothetical protein HOR18_gp128 [Staphylococcus phage vB_SscM-1]ANT44791.1 hypothetical protein vB_SscM-1_127 [Staphylococcus phage vB_SscM-1]ANT44993.1 hypothetical protein vB_SscM-2_126 [Staphylococcus phage vB_SscM-2]QQV88513.1 hypothetical protein [Staphylococcus phage ZCSS1]